MGRHDFRSQQAYDAATHLLSSKRLPRPPPWYNTIANVPPTASQLLVRPAFRHTPKRKKASKLFSPVEMKYSEDHLRSKFFADHPWELARPRIVLESDGKDYQQEKWDKMIQPSKKLDGESLVQRQLYLMERSRISQKEAYDQARKEFYAFRHREDIQRRVAREEALNTGAYFGPSQIDIGVQLEGVAYDDWKQWAEEESLRKRQEAAAMYTDTTNEPSPTGPEAAAMYTDTSNEPSPTGPEAAAMYTDTSNEPSPTGPEADELEPQPEEHDEDEELSGANGNRTAIVGNMAEP